MSASGLWREELCPPSAWLPRVRQLHADATAGTLAHAEAAAEEPEGAEVGLALDYEKGTARFAEPRGENGYPDLRPNEERGTTDRIWMAGDLLTIDDRKTGFGYMVAPAGSNLQLAFYAVAGSLVFGVDRVRVRLLDGEGAVTSEAILDAIDLDLALARIRGIKRASAESKRRGVPEVVTGDHCWRCEAANGCPAYIAALTAMGRGEAGVVWPSAGSLDEPELAKAIAAARVAQKALKTFWAGVYAIASERPLRLANGKLFGPRPTTKRTIDADVARIVLRDMHGQAVADAASDFRTSQEAIKKALRPVAPKRGLTKAFDAAMEAIEKANGLRKTEGVEFDEYDPEASAPALTQGEPNGAAQG